MLVLVLLVVALNGITVLKVSNISPIDEEMWIDYLVHGSKFEIAHRGDRLSEESVYELCVRGGPTLVSPHPPCDARPLRPAQFRWHGVNIAGHTPFYFLITGPVARVLRATPIDLPPNDSLATWGRLLGSAWLLIGWYFVLRIGDILGTNRRWLVVSLVLLSATPALLYASTIVNPDQTAVPAGAAVLLAILAWERRGRGMLWVALVALVAAALDPTNAVAIVVGLMYLLFRAIATRSRKRDEHSRSWTDYGKVAVLMVVAAVVANRGWSYIEPWFSTPSPVPGVNVSQNPVQHIGPEGRSLSLSRLFGRGTVFGIFPPFADIPSVYTPRFHDPFLLMAKGAELFAIGAMLAIALRDAIVDRIGSLGFALMAALLVSPVLFVLYNYWFTDGGFIPAEPRFGLSALPALAVVIATAARTRFSRGLLVFLAAGLYISAIYVVL